jgi:hypothetical protein
VDYPSFQCGELVKRPIDVIPPKAGEDIPGDNYASGGVDGEASPIPIQQMQGPPLPPVQQIATQWYLPNTGMV